MSHEKFRNCIDACNNCAVECAHCAIACLNEQQADMLKRCFHLDLEYAALCRSAAEVMSMGGSSQLWKDSARQTFLTD